MKENILIDKSIDFGARIVKLHRYLSKEKHETVLSKQILRSGTSIGANSVRSPDRIPGGKVLCIIHFCVEKYSPAAKQRGFIRLGIENRMRLWYDTIKIAVYGGNLNEKTCRCVRNADDPIGCVPVRLFGAE